MPKIFNRGGVFSNEGIFENTLRAYPIVPVDSTVVAKTTDYTLLPANNNCILTNTGASGTVVFTLPAVRNSIGVAFRVHLFAAQIVRLLPQTGEAVNLAGSAVVTKYLNIAAVIGNYCDVYCNGTQWQVVGFSGVVTKEA